MNKWKEVKMDYIVTTAIKLFLNDSITNVTIKDIALESGVGEATIYRYFDKKQNIVVQAALKLQEEVFNTYLDFSNCKTAYEKIELFYKSYLNVFSENVEYFRFIYEFDIYMIDEVDFALDKYEEGFNRIKKLFISFYEDGIKDQSIRKQENIDAFYYSTTHALLGLCKKLSMDKGVLKEDMLHSKFNEVTTLVDIVLFSLKRM